MHQPQLEAWNGDELRTYAALAVMSTSNKTTNHGVVWFTARTEVDKVNRQVTLDNFEITRITFPMMKTKEYEFQAFLQAALPGKSKVIALDRLEVTLKANDSEQAGVEAFPVNNEPPKIISTTKPFTRPHRQQRVAACLSFHTVDLPVTLATLALKK
jgi:hypothetical protein